MCYDTHHSSPENIYNCCFRKRNITKIYAKNGQECNTFFGHWNSTSNFYKLQLKWNIFYMISVIYSSNMHPYSLILPSTFCNSCSVITNKCVTDAWSACFKKGGQILIFAKKSCKKEFLITADNSSFYILHMYYVPSQSMTNWCV